MMISPESFAHELGGKSYQELRAIKDDLAAQVTEFERDRLSLADSDFCRPGEPFVCPSPAVVYQMNLEYLAKVCEKLLGQFNREFKNPDEDEDWDSDSDLNLD